MILDNSKVAIYKREGQGYHMNKSNQSAFFPQVDPFKDSVHGLYNKCGDFRGV